MREHKNQDTVIISIITAAVFFLILTLFGESQATALVDIQSDKASLTLAESYKYELKISNGENSCGLHLLQLPMDDQQHMSFSPEKLP